MPEEADLVQDVEPEVQETPSAARRRMRFQPPPLFRWRLLTGLVGASAVLVVHVALCGSRVVNAWKWITEGHEGPCGCRISSCSDLSPPSCSSAPS
ncbi:MAG TPA: hypothetical protein ENN09_00160 [Planctomycetes bacterium]|nr:hypothetical protein [Planctomycetota bacterium]